MSAEKISENEGSTKVCCANCGVAAVDEIELKPCPHCNLVQYCSDKCQQDHRELHEEACKQRAAEMRNEILFKQPESSHLGDCPICFLPMPLDNNARSIHACCGVKACNGCSFANTASEVQQGREDKCPFCRTIVVAKHGEEVKKRMLRRAEANDPIALEHLGQLRYEEEDYESAFRYWTRAAEVGDVNASFQLGSMYWKGKFVENDMDNCIAHWEQAAIGGHVVARYTLGHIEELMERFDRAVKHWIIAASLGHNGSIHELKNCYKEGYVSKDDLARALRANQAACDAMKSPQREAAAKIYEQIHGGSSIKN